MPQAKAVQFFCSHANRTLMPTFKSTLLLIITHLTTLNLSHATIKLSTVQHNYACHCWAHFYFTQQLKPQLQQVRKVFKKLNQASSPPQGVSTHLSLNNECLLLQKPPSYAHVLIWAACWLAFLVLYGLANLLCQPKANMTNTTCYTAFF